MPSKGINQPNEQSIYDGGKLEFKPRKIAGSKIRGTSGKTPPAPSQPAKAQPILVSELEALFTGVEEKFKDVEAQLDKKGEALAICQNVPETIRVRLLRQKRTDETCWGFYKRMVRLAHEIPNFDPYNPETLAERLSRNGNDVLTDPFTTDMLGMRNLWQDTFNPALPSATLPAEPARATFDENPGKITLLLMLFLAILRLVVDAIFAVMVMPLTFTIERNRELQAEKEEKSPPGIGLFGPIAAVASQVYSTVKGVINFATKLIPPVVILAAAKDIAFNWLSNLILKGPKLTRDVERFDALIINRYIQELAYRSELNSWPDAVLLFQQFDCLYKQLVTSQGTLGYFKSDNNLGQVTGSFNVGTTVPADIGSMLKKQGKFLDESLDRMSVALAGRAIDFLFCCFFRWIGGFSDEALRTMQGVLHFSLNQNALILEGIDVNLGNIWTYLQHQILNQVAAVMNNLVAEAQKKVRDILQGQPTGVLGTCPSWDFFTGIMLELIGGMERTLLKLLLDWGTCIQVQADAQIKYTQRMQDTQYVRLMLKLIDIIALAKKAGELCKNSSIPSDSELRMLYNQIREDVEPEIPGSVPGAATTAGASATTTVAARGASGFEECLKRVPPDDLARVTAWIEHLTNN